MVPALEVADIFRRHGEAFRQAHVGHLGYVERRIMGAITACRTAVLGGHVAYNSCRNRHCPWQKYPNSHLLLKEPMAKTNLASMSVDALLKLREEIAKVLTRKAGQLKDQLSRLEGETGGYKRRDGRSALKGRKMRSNTEIHRRTHGREEGHSPFACESN
jgi:hypothetical protein